MTGPIKGAIALANSLSLEREVHLVTIKRLIAYEPALDKKIKIICLADYSSNFLQKILYYRKLLQNSGPKKNVVSVSMLFSADLINLFCFKQASICSSIRGNLPEAYKMDYGYMGYILGIMHLIFLRRFNKIVTMSNEMKKQVKYYSGKDSKIIGNFIDENQLELYRHNKFHNKKTNTTRFIFLGRVAHGKNPILLLNTIFKLHKNGFKVFLDIIGDGPILPLIRDKVEELKINNIVKIHGNINNPFPKIVEGDFFVLPSLTEGTPRACLEALYLGIPCILRKVDGNSELIQEGENGFLFQDDNDLYNVMKSVIESKPKTLNKDILLPSFYRQSKSSKSFLSFIETD